MVDAEVADSRKPVYVPFSTLTGFIEHVKPRGLPPVIDGTAMDPSLAKGMKSQLGSALRFLKLVDDGGRVQPLLTRLVESYGTAAWKASIRTMTDAAYSDIVAGLDISTATMGMLNERFETKAGAHGQVLEKAVRFYLSALKQAEVQLSGHLDPKGNGDGALPVKRLRPQRRGRPAGQGLAQQHQQPAPPIKEGWIEHSFPLRRDLTLKLELPVDLRAADVERIHKWLATLPVEEGSA